MNFWPIDNNLIDVVGGKYMTEHGNASFTNDRFGLTDSAISFNHGYYSIPPGVYFNGDFTITFWGSPIDHATRFLMFSFQSNDSIFFYLDKDSYPMFGVDNGPNKIEVKSQSPVQLNTWQHFAITLNINNALIFVNGNMMANKTTYTPNNVFRIENYFGLYESHAKRQAKMDLIKFYNRALEFSEIQTESKNVFNKI